MVSEIGFYAFGVFLFSSITLSSTNELTARQVNVIPPSCERTCSPVNGVIFSPEDCDAIPEFCCPRTDMLQFVDCFQCFDDDAFTKTGQHADNAQRQKVIDDLISICDARGFLIDVSKAQVTLPGQDINRPGIDIVPDNDPRSSMSATRSTSTSSSASPSSRVSSSSPNSTTSSPSTQPTATQTTPSSTPRPTDTNLPSNNTAKSSRISGSNIGIALSVVTTLLSLLSRSGL
ncbi:hypothetical protein BJ165DRAFT_1491241 [Panaeolus papilionaceus]|nr:hypothetical protein BJ165DRAFT_1491241 [Panaeolus papilionaceus]